MQTSYILKFEKMINIVKSAAHTNVIARIANLNSIPPILTIIFAVTILRFKFFENFLRKKITNGPNPSSKLLPPERLLSTSQNPIKI
jgi:hypothetical protein